MTKFQRWWTPVIAAYSLWRVWLFLLTLVALRYFSPEHWTGYLGSDQFRDGLPEWITAWGNFDGVIFMRIARGGYGIPEVPFFPLLPLLLRGFVHFGIPMIVGGLVISLVSFGVAWLGMMRLWKLDQPKLSWIWLLVVLLIFPTAHYYTAVYQDSLFLALSTWCLVWAREKRWFLAALMGFFAMLARLNGLALVMVFVAEYMIAVKPSLEDRWGVVRVMKVLPSLFHPRRLFRQHAWVWLALCIPLAFIGYLAYVDHKVGDWYYFFSSVETWHRNKLTFPLVTFWRYCKILILYANVTFVYWVALGEALATALYVLALSWGGGRIRLSYWLFAFVHLLIPLLTGTLQGMPRYGLHLYPLFLILATWLAPRAWWVKVIYIAIMLFLQVLYVLSFVGGRFVA